MIEQEKLRVSYYEVDSLIKEYKEDNDGKEPTGKEMLEHLLGDSEGWSNSDYTLERYKYSTKNRSVLQRLNWLWVYPLFLITTPFQWIFTGNVGLSKNSRIGRVVDKLIKF